jgi:hypothetical protein
MFEVVSWAALPTFTCPHCNKDTEHPPALLFDTLMMSRATCRRCNQEFLIVDDEPMTEEQYQMRNPPRPEDARN